jgi:hypothetical protein
LSDLIYSVLRIIDNKGATLGTGFLITSDLIVTCAHVVKSTLLFPGNIVRVQPYQYDDIYIAQLYDYGYTLESKFDVAFLKLNTPITGFIPVRMADAELAKPGATFTSLGFPQSPIAVDHRPYGSIHGLVNAHSGAPLLEIEGNSIYRGMSGAPVLDQNLDRVIGMISQGWDDKYERIAYAIPAEIISQLYYEVNLPRLDLHNLSITKAAISNRIAQNMLGTLDSKNDDAKVEILKKENQIPDMRPGYDFGIRKGLLTLISSETGAAGIIQEYNNGLIIYHTQGSHAGETFAVYGGIYYRYSHLEEKPWAKIGLPVSDEHNAAWSPFKDDEGEPIKGRYSVFEKGEIVWHETGDYQEQAFIILDPIRKTYDSIGGSSSYLGFPISDCYTVDNVMRCDFEGGSIVYLKEKESVSIVRSLLTLDYSDSPFNHGWVKYDGPEDQNCLKVRLDTRIGFQKNMVALNNSLNSRAVFFPDEKFSDVTERYIGITVKTLHQDDQIKIFLRLKTPSENVQYLELDTHDLGKGFIEGDEEGVDYWRIPLPLQCKNTEWHTLIMDLETIVGETYKTKFEGLERFYFRGHIGVSDIMISNSREAIQIIAINPISIK